MKIIRSNRKITQLASNVYKMVLGNHGRPVTMKTGGGQINKTGRAQSKSGEAPMVKIKDFTLASQNLGGGAFDPPCPAHRAPMLATNRSLEHKVQDNKQPEKCDGHPIECSTSEWRLLEYCSSIHSFRHSLSVLHCATVISV